MPDFVKVDYQQTKDSTKTNELGMREMQAKAYAERNRQYLLLKAPPACGKSRALMFIALDKLCKQGIKKVIVTVPETAIGSSFKSTNLIDSGFWADWLVSDKYNLCLPGIDTKKVEKFQEFLNSDTEKILLCAHATFRNAYSILDVELLDNCLIAIDEFHHVSADPNNNQLGEYIREIIQRDKSHILAMTGSYFRGDAVPILSPAEEQLFTKVTYTYYEQLNGYEYLKSLGLGYHFYQGRYLDAINEVLDTNKKTIIHIPNVNSAESTKDKSEEVGIIIDNIGEIEKEDPETGLIYVKRRIDGKVIKVADLVNDDPKARDKIKSFLYKIKSADDLDIIIALGMAKEGFDWEFCEHALTIGYRNSHTEVIQIIGRCTRDSNNKIHAQFTNLIAQPDAEDSEVKIAVNNVLKAISCSLLMEQVLAPKFYFKTKKTEDDKSSDQRIFIKGFKEPSTERVKQICETDLQDLKASIMQNDLIIKAIPGTVPAETINKNLIPKIIREIYPDLNNDEVEELRQHVVVDAVIKKSTINEAGDNTKFITMANRFINIDELNIDLIDQINPFQKAYEILSKSITAKILMVIRDTIDITRIDIEPEEAIALAPKLKQFIKDQGREPEIQSIDPFEKRLAEVRLYIINQKRKHGLG
ncbi:MAG: DEAD/DEAH box helicase [bacterium]